jgi:thiamine-phosphate pyrophosphorylase
MDGMFADLTPAAARILASARSWADRQGASDVQPVHLLQGLLAEDEGRPVLLLAGAGVDVTSLRQLLTPGSSGLDLPQSDRQHPLSPATQAILSAAHELAGDVSADRTVASEHLLVALLRGTEALRQQVESFGLVLTTLEARAFASLAPRLTLEEPLRLPEPTEQIDAARILDANTNRAREALRVIEDYCRFVLDDAFLTAQLKQLRHDLTQTLASVPAGLRLAARETLRDGGTALSTEAEQQRHSLVAVVHANLKRLQEALRSLEEFGKLASPRLGQAVEQIRYRSYTLERAIVLGATARQRLAHARLYVLVSGAGCLAALDWTIREAAAGGAQVVQLREKHLTDRELLERARQVRRWTQEAGVLFIMNDRPDISRLAEADGVHVGQDEMPVKEARRILGPDALIGVSTHNLDQVGQAVLDGASYIGVGPTFPSATKHFDELGGLDFVRQAAAETSLPAFVIGGVTLETIGAAIAAGARRVAVSRAICQADDPRAVAVQLRATLDELERTDHERPMA